MGEAEKPGPLAGFDDASDKAWSEYSDHSQEEAEQPEDWMLPPTEMEAAMEEFEFESTAAATVVEAASKVRDVWSDLHANDTFEPTKVKRFTKLSKFDGAKPGRVFKTGDRGLGYYRDSGGLRAQLSLDLALHALRSVPVATISLDGLVTPSHVRGPGGSGSGCEGHPTPEVLATVGQNIRCGNWPHRLPRLTSEQAGGPTVLPLTPPAGRRYASTMLLLTRCPAYPLLPVYFMGQMIRANMLKNVPILPKSMNGMCPGGEQMGPMHVQGDGTSISTTVMPRKVSLVVRRAGTPPA